MGETRSQRDDLLQQLGISRPTDYQPYYCEENIYRLAAGLAPEHNDTDRSVLFISNEQQTCALMHQRAAPPDQIIVWDYHVVLLLTFETNYWVVDLDTRLDAVTPAATYLQKTFGRAIPRSLRPRFRMVGLPEFLDWFSTDRRHMHDDSGWLQRPPPWEPPRGPQAASPHELPRFIDTTASGPGQVLTLQEVTDYVSITTGAPELRRAQRR